MVHLFSPPLTFAYCLPSLRGLGHLKSVTIVWASFTSAIGNLYLDRCREDLVCVQDLTAFAGDHDLLGVL